MSNVRMAGVIAPGLAFLIFVGLMINDYLNDPFDPNLKDMDSYWHNGEGILYLVIPMTFVELAVFYGIIRPWSWRWTIGRPLIAFISFAPWWYFSLSITIFAGGVVGLHFFWVTVILGFILLVILGIAIARLWSYIKQK